MESVKGNLFFEWGNRDWRAQTCTWKLWVLIKVLEFYPAYQFFSYTLYNPAKPFRSTCSKSYITTFFNTLIRNLREISHSYLFKLANWIHRRFVNFILSYILFIDFFRKFMNNLVFDCVPYFLAWILQSAILEWNQYNFPIPYIINVFRN